MKLIIDIDEDYYKAIWENGYIYDEDNEDIAKIIKDGTLLEEKIGHWINQHVIYANATTDFKVCSECRYEFSYDAETGVSDANYCPYCGAKMKGE